MTDARQYVALAEAANGPIPQPADFAYPWGEALAAWARFASAVRTVNLETAVTASDNPWPGKGIHYRSGTQRRKLAASAKPAASL